MGRTMSKECVQVSATTIDLSSSQTYSCSAHSATNESRFRCGREDFGTEITSNGCRCNNTLLGSSLKEPSCETLSHPLLRGSSIGEGQSWFQCCFCVLYYWFDFFCDILQLFKKTQQIFCDGYN